MIFIAIDDSWAERLQYSSGRRGGGVSGEGALFALIAFLEDTKVRSDAFGFAKRFSDVADMLPSDG